MATLKGELQLNGKAVFTEEDIRNNFSPKEILCYFKSGRLSQVCSKNSTLKEKIDSIKTDIVDSLIIKELAMLFKAEFDYDEYLKREQEEKDTEIEKELKERQKIVTALKEIEEQKRKHEEIKFLDSELKKYLKKTNSNVGSSLISFNIRFGLLSEESINRIKTERFNSKSTTEIKKILYEKINKKQTLCSDELLLLKTWYGSN